MSYNLFLDDIRDVAQAFIYPRRSKSGIVMLDKTLTSVSEISHENWVVVRSYDEFVDTINNRGIPGVVSFDHDLHEEHIEYYFKYVKQHNQIDYDCFTHKTGYHCAVYLRDYCKSKNVKLPICYVHSANIVGANNIKRVLQIC